jgi:hypothetical protein
LISLLDAIAKVCRETHLPMIHAEFGDPGVNAAFEIMRTLKALYRHVEPERVSGEVIVYVALSDAGGNAQSSPRPALNFGALANATLTDLLIEVGPDGLPYEGFLPSGGIAELAQSGVVYRWRHNEEEFWAGTQRRSVVRLDPSARSQFSLPTFATLRDALNSYAVENVRESSCPVLEVAWHDGNRLFFKAAPEIHMRRSLALFLRNRLGVDHDVWQEQIVDESHPVDIRVTPRFDNNRLMLIEIKWLGDSANELGHITVKHRDARAKEGAEQLSGYLDSQRKTAPTSIAHGYYVIVDGRRKALRAGDSTISREHGLYYENVPVIFEPAYHETRHDFDPPYRMFATPVCND